MTTIGITIPTAAVRNPLFISFRRSFRNLAKKYEKQSLEVEHDKQKE